MELNKCLRVVIVVIVSVHGITGQVASMCRANERFLSCGGCQTTCNDPTPNCVAVCREGCFCESGMVRNDAGHCVRLDECPSFSSDYLSLQTTEPRTISGVCYDNEEYRFCEPCKRTCDNPNPICPAQCARGCFCIKGFVRRSDGKCVPISDCPKKEREGTQTQEKETQKEEMQNEDFYGNHQPQPFKTDIHSCGLHQTFKQCQECETICGFFIPVCRKPCHAGCFCDDGFVRSTFGDCVKIEDCPQVPFWSDRNTNGNVSVIPFVIESSSENDVYKNENDSTLMQISTLNEKSKIENDDVNFMLYNHKNKIGKDKVLLESYLLNDKSVNYNDNDNNVHTNLKTGNSDINNKNEIGHVHEPMESGLTNSLFDDNKIKSESLQNNTSETELESLKSQSIDDDHLLKVMSSSSDRRLIDDVGKSTKKVDSIMKVAQNDGPKPC